MSSETGNGKKKKIAASAAAVALAAALMIGGTLSYLKSQSATVTNSFSANTDYVSLNETTGDDYDIIPGTSQEKDPTITYAATVETYVFVEVTDATDGLVTWAIADGWTLLSSSTDEDGVTTYVYYQKVDATVDEDGNLTSKTLQVLKNNTVYYSADLDNDDMLESSTDEDGNTTYTLKTGITLSFKAYTIQTASLDDPEIAYAYATGSSTSVSTSNALSSALSSGDTYITLSSDITVDSALEVSEDSVVLIDLNGYTLSSSSSSVIEVEGNAYLVVTGGTIASSATSGSYYAVDNEGGTVTLEDVTITNAYTYAIVNHGTMTLENCTVSSESTSSSMIENGWQTASNNTDGTNSVMTINGGTYTCAFYAVKNDDYGVLTINDGTFTCTSSNSGTVLNWNELTINGGTFVSEGYVIYNTSASDSSSDAYTTYEKGKLTINGGSFTSGNSKKYLMYDYNCGAVTITDGTFTSASTAIGYKSTNGTYTISGGTYSSQYLAYGNSTDYTNSCLESGYTLQSNSDGTYSVVASSTDSGSDDE